ncbi:MAG: hypothetical protein IKD76_04060 [Clostridia bacterium]|nr:hypothetical protein [Clostridia bacterium]
MNKLTNEQMDEIIKAKFKSDRQISDKANSVFENFKQGQYNNPFINNFSKEDNKDGLFYQKLNRILSVAAVSLTVVLVGGSALYFNKGNVFNQNNINNNSSQGESVVYNQTNLVKNEKLEFSNEQVLKEVEKGFVKVYMLGKRDVAINLTSTYWNEFNNEFTSTACYKIANITKNVLDIFIGEISGAGLPYVFLLMEDGTVEYVDLHCYTNREFYFTTSRIDGLNDVVAFEQKLRNYSYSTAEYQYVNAIRSDGLRKEIEIGIVNNWYDNETVNFNKLNDKYIKVHNKVAVPDDGQGDYTVDNITYLCVNGEYSYAYFKRDNKFYRIDRSNAKEECLAEGVLGYVRSGSDGRLNISLADTYFIYALDKNIVFKEKGTKVITEVTQKQDAVDTGNENQANNQGNNQGNNQDNNIVNNIAYPEFAELANKYYKNDSVKLVDSSSTFCHEIKFDKNGKPTLKIEKLGDKKNETILETKDIQGINRRIGTDSFLVSFDFMVNMEGEKVVGSAEIKFDKVSNVDKIGVKVTLESDAGLQRFDNAGDYIYLEKLDVTGYEVTSSDGSVTTIIYGKQFARLHGTSSSKFVYYIDENDQLKRTEDAVVTYTIASKVKSLRVDADNYVIYVEQEKDGEKFGADKDYNLVFNTIEN